MRTIGKTILLSGVILLACSWLWGCSGEGGEVIVPTKTIDSPTQYSYEESQHGLWGFWAIRFDEATLKLDVEPQRNLEMHFDITDQILPPACDNCLEIIFNSFDTETGSLVFGIILRNPFPLTGHDVRGIIYTDDAGHLLTNGDDWTGLHDMPGGQGLNPFKGFYGFYGESEFGPAEARLEMFEVYIPDPPHFTEFNFAVTASYPGKCKEPYAITDFSHPPLYDVTGHSSFAEVKVSDWQDDVNKVTLVAPEITGESFTQFYPHEDMWRVQIVNNTGVGAGEYEARIIAASSGSGNLALYDYVTIEITEADSPVPLYIDPTSAINGSDLVDVDLKGVNFSGPDSEVILTCDSGPDIVATDVEVLDPITIRCDLSIPHDALLGLYDVEITNSLGKTGVGEEMFLVHCPEPMITSVEPKNHSANDTQFTLFVLGGEFIDGPDLAVKLCEGGQADIVATNVTWVDVGTLTCDITIPVGTWMAYWGVEVTNGCGTVAIKYDAFHVHNLVWNEPSISLDIGFNTKVRDASTPAVSSYQWSTDFIIQGDLCTGAQGTPAYEYYISTSDTGQAGDIWHEFTFTGDDKISVDWTDYKSIAPSHVWLWVRCVDGPDYSGFHLLATPLQLSHQIWGDAGFDTGWTWWGLEYPAWNVNSILIQVFNISSETGDGGIRRNGTTILSQGYNYTLESCSEWAWTSYIGCYMEPQIGETGALGTAIGEKFTHRNVWEFLSASFTVPSSASWHVGFYVVDGCPLDTSFAFNFFLDNICLYHDP